VLGAIAVLAAGSIWRRRKFQRAQHVLSPASGAVRPINRP
jgi:hypothetical protein